ncbi:MAG TPA: nucleotidyltransferase domain-containing protein [Candidatus Nanoarchaeia archaeon]|nr:nucleotidyltransferase domain-containing protein [Candidatus Nanoarchaeia archaeon]
MITSKQLNLFQVFAKQPFTEITLKQIKDLAKEKSNHALEIAMVQFKKEKLFLERKVGKSTLYSLDFNNDKIYYYIALANHERLSTLMHRSIKYVKEEALGRTKFLSIVIFGSYAVGKETKESDLDVSIFIEDEKYKNKIKASLSSAELKSPLPLDSHVITRDEFMEMLLNNEENLGKEIARKHLAVYNHPLFYSLILEGMKHGFHI